MRNSWVLGNRVQDPVSQHLREWAQGPGLKLNITRCPFPRGAQALATLGAGPAPAGAQAGEKRKQAVLTVLSRALRLLGKSLAHRVAAGGCWNSSQGPPQQGGNLNQHPFLGEERTWTTSGPQGCRRHPHSTSILLSNLPKTQMDLEEALDAAD